MNKQEQRNAVFETSIVNLDNLTKNILPKRIDDISKVVLNSEFLSVCIIVFVGNLLEIFSKVSKMVNSWVKLANSYIFLMIVNTGISNTLIAG